MTDQVRYRDLAEVLAESNSQHGKLRRLGKMLDMACAAAPVADAEVSKSLWDCMDEYADALADCENAYSAACVNADESLFACLLSAKTKKEVGECMKQYDLALDNAALAFDGCEAVIAANWIDCFKQV